jgi:hypothetical protein
MNTFYTVKVGGRVGTSTMSVWDALIKVVGSDRLANRFINNVSWGSYRINPQYPNEGISIFTAKNGMPIGYTAVTMH